MVAAVTRRCWLLARVSTNKRGQDTSNARQLEALRIYAARMGWEVVGEGEERISGAKGEADRPALAEAMQAVRAMRVDTLVVTRLDRLGRSVRHVLDVAAELEVLRCGLVVAEMAGLSWTDSQTAMGRFLLQIFAALAELYRADYADRTRLALAARRAKGLPLGPPVRVRIPLEAAAWARTVRAGGCSWSWVATRAPGILGASYRYSVAAWRRAVAALPQTLPGFAARDGHGERLP
jgi:DNA invertase Pin-like site-specific DNA recombinase